MRVLVNWLSEFVDTGLPIAELSHRLTMAGLEIEGQEAHGDDTALEVNVTPNRPDCLSILGIARELKAITGKPLRLPKHELGDCPASSFKVEILEPALCNRYAGRVIRGVKIGPSPEWMKARLEGCGIRSINNIVDITNYALLEFGHPLHAFDLATLKGGIIRVARAGNGSSITTLDGAKRELPEEALLIWDAQRPVAVAGVMGGADTEVTQKTTDIFLESAWFDPSSVRRTSKRLGLSTEASYRFERGTDIEMLECALDRAALLIAELAGGKVERIVDAWPVKHAPREVSISYDRVNKVLGTQIRADEMLEIMGRLGFKVLDAGGSMSITPPPYRPDITIWADLIEEVARLYGFGRIPTALPVADIASSDKSAKRRALIRQIKTLLCATGYSEAINYSFMNVRNLDLLRIAQADERRKCIEVKNPLRAEDAHMRTSLVPSLMENYIHNLSRGARSISLFEVARVFIDTGEQLPDERLRLGGIHSAIDDTRALYKEGAQPFYIAKGVVEALLDMLRIDDRSFVRSAEPFLHPGKAADVMLAGKRVGCVGVVSPDVLEAFGAKTKSEVVVFDLDLEALLSAAPEKGKYRWIPKHPSVERDIAMIVEKSIYSADVVGAILAYPSEIVEDAAVFDEYMGKGVPEGKKSLAFNIVYRSPDRTLTDEEVESVHKEIVSRILEDTGGQLRA